MKKLIVVIAVMAMVPASFGATLKLLNDDGTDSRGTSVPNGGTFTLNVVVDGAQGLLGLSYAVATDAPGKIQLTGRTITSAVLTDLTSTNAQLLQAAVAVLNPKNGRDIGAVSGDGVSTVNGKETIATLTFTALGDLAAAGAPPVHIMVVGPGTLSNPSWNDADFNQTNMAIETYTITPEPMSMMLLAAGAAFFARRRA